MTTNYSTDHRNSGLAIATLILGIASIVLALLSPVLGALAVIAGLTTYFVARNKGEAVVGFLKTGRLLLIIGAVVAVLNFILGIILLSQ